MKGFFNKIFNPKSLFFKVKIFVISTNQNFISEERLTEIKGLTTQKRTKRIAQVTKLLPHQNW